ncbi:uncharacterized protein KRP23_5090 [Phytophthora ramorum]|uniref:uncharacterized protein n=1 Tax=Phytophthora ramorum TaxID=164328 RepID=UPI0030AF6F1B|nr:hypothetical protein KRP23_5090 [Phytophthora ramorum]
MAVAGDDDPSNSAPGDAVRVPNLPKLDGDTEDALTPKDDDNKDVNDGSDTPRVVNSAISYARECLRSENYTETTIALRSALEIVKPSSDLYKKTVLHIAQLLKAAQQLKASIDCMLSVYQKMPPPFSRSEGICIIARTYEQLDSMDAALFWWKKLVVQSDSGSIDSPVKPNFLEWEAMADRLFDEELYVFAADFYGQALELAPETTFVPTNRFKYRYLVALLAFVGPQGPTMHMNLPTSESSDAHREVKVRPVSKKPIKYYGGSPPKRSSVSFGSSEEMTDDHLSPNLLDVYPLQLSRSENFVAICGREPGFADLNLDEVSAFARLAHYRAQVLAGKHARIDKLDTASVKPQWLHGVEKATALIETHLQRNVASGKMVADIDSIAHLSEVHTRLVLLITTLCRQYTRDFGETSFTRRLRVLTRRLIEWKFSRISEVVAALNDAKSVATHEEAKRNLEFYHVYCDRKDEIQSHGETDKHN